MRAASWKLLPGWKEAREYMLKDVEHLRDTYSGSVRTPFEFHMGGGIPTNWTYLNNRGRNIQDYHTPVSVLGRNRWDRKRATIYEVNLLRTTIKFDVWAAGGALGFYSDPDLEGKFLAVSLEPLDPVTGVTIRDPQILGIYDKEIKAIQQLEGRDLNVEYYQHLKELASKLGYKNQILNYVRDGKSLLEKEGSGTPERE